MFTNLFIQEDLPYKVRPEVLNLCIYILLHNSIQRDPELIQLGLQRGQLRGLLQIHNHVISSPTCLCIHYFFRLMGLCFLQLIIV